VREYTDSPRLEVRTIDRPPCEDESHTPVAQSSALCPERNIRLTERPSRLPLAIAPNPDLAWPGRIVRLSVAVLRRLLAHPLTAGLELDDPTTTELRSQIISSKPFLRTVYDEWYSTLRGGLPAVEGAVLELGSGAGYCNRFIPGLITSEPFYRPTVQIVANALQMPFRDASLRAIVFTDVMHHIPDVHRFLVEATRCLKVGGRILMIEPWVSAWSRFVYTRFHHEPFRPEAEAWSISSTGPLSGANVAVPWIVFVRDRERFESEFPHLVIDQIRPFLPFRYLLSGGVAMRSLMPGFSHGLWVRLERLLEPYMSHLAMFAFVSVRRR
jgi:SAM-dependent methyltransferase